MNQADNSFDFKVTVPLEKSLHENDSGWYIKGIAAAAHFQDEEGDILLPEAIEMLAAQINDEPVPFRNTHKADSITEDMGQVIKARATPDFQLEVEVELDQDNPEAQYLWTKLGKGKKYGMSIRGSSVNPIIEKGVKSYISKHRAVHLKEISATTRPFFTHSFGTVLRKAIVEADASLATLGENTIMADSITGETPAQESSAPENDTVVTEVSPSEELVKSLMSNEDFTSLIKTAVLEAVASQAGNSEDTTEISKSEEDESAAESASPTLNVEELVKSIVTELNASTDAKIEALASRIADRGPAVLVKSEQETADDVIRNLRESNPRNALRAALAYRHGEQDRL
jgi:hypothetical protein